MGEWEALSYFWLRHGVNVMFANTEWGSIPYCPVLSGVAPKEEHVVAISDAPSTSLDSSSSFQSFGVPLPLRAGISLSASAWPPQSRDEAYPTPSSNRPIPPPLSCP